MDGDREGTCGGPMTMNMTSHRKWFLAVLVILAASIVFVVIVNCVVDAYGILRSDFTLQFQEPNHSYVKTKYLLSGKGPFDSLLFGSSRVNFINPAKIPNGSYYNYWYSEGIPPEHLANLKLLLERGVTIRNIALGLDEFSYLVDPAVHNNNLLRQPHPLASGKSRLAFYREYFFRGSIRDLQRFVLHNVLDRGKVKEFKGAFDIYKTGQMFLPLWDEQIEQDPAKHLKKEVFSRPTHYEGDRIEATLRDIRKFVDLAEHSGINLVVFINPVHRTTYLDTNLSQFFTFKRKLAQITDYYDFSGLNSITTNNYYYYESSHYRMMVGDMMVSRMFGLPKVSVPDDFGVRVTSLNVDAHLKRLCRQLQKADVHEHEKNCNFKKTCSEQ